MKTKVTVKNTIIYVLGFLIVGLGINLMDKSTLGLGAWDTVTFNLYDYLIIVLGLSESFVKVGYVSGVIAMILMSAVLLYRKKAKYLLMLIPIFLMVNVINLWYYLVFESIVVEAFYLELLFFILGLVFLPLGLSLVVSSSYPAFVFEEFTFMLRELFHIKTFAIARLIIEFSGIAIGSLFGFLLYLHDNSLPLLGSVGFGSFIVMFSIGPSINFFLKVLKVNHQGVQEDE